MRKNLSKLILLGVVVTALTFHFVWLRHWLSFSNLQAMSEWLKDITATHPFYSAIIFTGVCATIVTLMIPISLVAFAAGGYAFGTLLGGTYALASATAGSCLTFIGLRRIFPELKKNLKSKLPDTVTREMKKGGAYYVAVSHFLSIIPFAMINTAAAVSPISLPAFLLGTFIGMIPIVYISAFAGQQFATITSAGDLLSGKMVLLIALLAALSSSSIILKFLRKKIRR